MRATVCSETDKEFMEGVGSNIIMVGVGIGGNYQE